MEALTDLKIERTTKSRLPGIDFDKISFGRVYSDHMVVADYIDKEWKNFSIVPYDSLRLLPGTSALHYGQSVFEGMKAYKNKSGEVLLFRPLDNFRRINLSAKRMCIPEIPEDIFMGGMIELLKIDRGWVPPKRDMSLYIRPFIFASDEYIGLKPSETYKFIIFTSPVGAYYSSPVRVKIEQTFVRAFEGGTGYAKAAGNYGSSMYPTKLAHEEGYHQLIWTDGREHKYIEEAGTMNLVFIIDHKLVTPECGDTILRGITRDSVMTLARDWGMTVEERKISVDEVIEACVSGRLNEAFGTGTAATIAPIELISYQGVDYKLPPEETRNVSGKLFETLENYKRGNLEDKFGWLYKV